MSLDERPDESAPGSGSPAEPASAEPARPADDVKRLASDEHWPRANARRHELIRKEYEGRIAPEELRELEFLQLVVAERLAPLDRLMIAELEEVIRKIKGSRDASSP
ncbi:MAG: hypothetical protein K2W96_13010 [Gemmataceae bacterium]|nr:hypothetical protein [Gemmataceae bacterium]